MKQLVWIFSVLFLVSCSEPGKEEIKESTLDINGSVESVQPETFSYQEGDTTYVMQKYFMVHLMKGPNRDQDSVTLAKLQTAHLAHLEALHLAGKISIAGPFEDESPISGIAIYHTATFEEADSLANADPMVKAGRLTIETHPFWAAKGSKLK
ncbi:Uncharacterized conserved protein YciI, contains a putative active-site phosphohistidine [Pustulibacterium marinum]|uniref:Uncharacterized conserved protein YciI, contains a putative active-site phosphohistidine n=1 Tax=Pustulibacterium marinum TaxID=1224947 RepID=A0A1I7ESP9_9FLAO|nr:YciI family protein [Pustulibacterium marinum]SFU26947.1 Uncharacterized conserved protein YciI, contains a putative active-site phosphohistidine [Pustulibacterium marinum]